jgi:hypothetical protein
VFKMEIGEAIQEMRNGKKLRRAGWNGKNMWVALQVPDAHSKMTEPYIYLSTELGHLVPMSLSQADVLATDWRVVNAD